MWCRHTTPGLALWSPCSAAGTDTSWRMRLACLRLIMACRKIAVTEQTYYRWRKEYGGMGTEQLKRLKELEKENWELKIENSKLKNSNNELMTFIDQLEDENASLRDMYFWIWWLLLIDYSRLYKLESFYFTTKKNNLKHRLSSYSIFLTKQSP